MSEEQVSVTKELFARAITHAWLSCEVTYHLDFHKAWAYLSDPSPLDERGQKDAAFLLGNDETS